MYKFIEIKSFIFYLASLVAIIFILLVDADAAAGAVAAAVAAAASTALLPRTAEWLAALYMHGIDADSFFCSVPSLAAAALDSRAAGGGWREGMKRSWQLAADRASMEVAGGRTSGFIRNARTGLPERAERNMIGRRVPSEIPERDYPNGPNET